MPDYNNGKIYEISCLDNDSVYIGSTTKQYLSDRLSDHVQQYKRMKFQNKGTNVTSSVLIETETYSIKLLEKFPCKDKVELHTREKYWIQQNSNCVNKQLPLRTKEQYYQDNKDKIIAKSNERYQTKKVEIREKKKATMICPVCQSEFRASDKARHNKSAKHQNAV